MLVRSVEVHMVDQTICWKVGADATRIEIDEIGVKVRMDLSEERYWIVPWTSIVFLDCEAL